MSALLCPRCGRGTDEWGDWRDHEGCEFVPCDSEDCRARREPVGASEWEAVAEHWKSHSYLSGCSHGR